jgi:hypothetical protein
MHLNLIYILEEKLRISSKSLTDDEARVIHLMISEHPENVSKIEHEILKIIATYSIPG